MFTVLLFLTYAVFFLTLKHGDNALSPFRECIIVLLEDSWRGSWPCPVCLVASELARLLPMRFGFVSFARLPRLSTFGNLR